MNKYTIEFKEPDYGKGERMYLYFNGEFTCYLPMTDQVLLEQDLMNLIYKYSSKNVGRFKQPSIVGLTYSPSDRPSVKEFLKKDPDDTTSKNN